MIRGVSSALSRSADAAGVLLVGGLLTLLTLVVTPAWVGAVLLFPPLVVIAPLALAPAFVLRGYLVRVVAGAGAVGNRNGAPPFVAWNELYRNGLKSATLSALLLAPLALPVAAVGLGIAAAATGTVDLAPAAEFAERALGPDGAPAVAGVGGGLLLVVSAAYLLAFAYVRPAALSAFAASGRLRDGLRPERVAAVAASGEYATAWVVAAATLGAGYALAAPFVPLVVGFAFVFAVRVAAHALYGRGAAEAIEFDRANRVASGDPGPADPVAPTARSAPPTAATGSLPSAAGASPDRSDGGYRRSPPEAPAPVQTGRPVPLVNDRAPSPDDGEGDADRFEWNVDLDAEAGGDARSDDRTPPADDRDDEERAPPVDGGFEWWAGADPENKS